LSKKPATGLEFSAGLFVLRVTSVRSLDLADRLVQLILQWRQQAMQSQAITTEPATIKESLIVRLEGARQVQRSVQALQLGHDPGRGLIGFARTAVPGSARGLPRMRQLFSMACYLGVTGTPLLKNEKNNFSQFGGVIAALDELGHSERKPEMAATQSPLSCSEACAAKAAYTALYVETIPCHPSCNSRVTVKTRNETKKGIP
jgi:hypothetical protein